MGVWDKEVRYFSRGVNMVDLCWYRQRYPCLPAGVPHVTFDGSPDYFVMSQSAVAGAPPAKRPSQQLGAA